MFILLKKIGSYFLQHKVVQHFKAILAPDFAELTEDVPGISLIIFPLMVGSLKTTVKHQKTMVTMLLVLLHLTHGAAYLHVEALKPSWALEINLIPICLLSAHNYCLWHTYIALLL